MLAPPFPQHFLRDISLSIGWCCQGPLVLYWRNISLESFKATQSSVIRPNSIAELGRTLMMASGGGQVYSLFPYSILDSVIAPLLGLFKRGKYTTILICFKGACLWPPWRSLDWAQLPIRWTGASLCQCQSWCHNGLFHTRHHNEIYCHCDFPDPSYFALHGRRQPSQLWQVLVMHNVKMQPNQFLVPVSSKLRIINVNIQPNQLLNHCCTNAGLLTIQLDDL